ncbi:hypothetical protein [Corynebacterium aquatimens]|uniref:Uncharacterized protein n=1 Tax=Corynebacterium aquatimens TaxID=1190508 RepID=A0A931DW95_9CORY|nr:hypothetical protein [Corynebacterium aquatimens]MBG6121397.1 hypothetical protein [Corynebacterium aquatimens]WJY66058.1 hypothetical protein CAQUA_06785 [Corynebacterium aquatimens]
MRLPLPFSIEQILGAILVILTAVGVIAGVVVAVEKQKSGEASPSTSVTTTPATPQPTVPRTPRPSADEPQRRDIHFAGLLRWDDYEVVDSTHVRIFYQAGSRGCYGEYANVKYNRDEVVIDLYAGTLPNSFQACTMELRGYSMLITLRSPLGNRTITQTRGAKPKPGEHTQPVETPTYATE